MSERKPPVPTEQPPGHGLCNTSMEIITDNTNLPSQAAFIAPNLGSTLAVTLHEPQQMPRRISDAEALDTIHRSGCGPFPESSLAPGAVAPAVGASLATDGPVIGVDAARSRSPNRQWCPGHAAPDKSSAFDDSDDSTEELDLARRSLLMQPRSVMPTSPAKAVSMGCALGAFVVEQQHQHQALQGRQQHYLQQWSKMQPHGGEDALAGAGSMGLFGATEAAYPVAATGSGFSVAFQQDVTGSTVEQPCPSTARLFAGIYSAPGVAGANCGATPQAEANPHPRFISSTPSTPAAGSLGKVVPGIDAPGCTISPTRTPPDTVEDPGPAVFLPAGSNSINICSTMVAPERVGPCDDLAVVRPLDGAQGGCQAFHVGVTNVSVSGGNPELLLTSTLRVPATRFATLAPPPSGLVQLPTVYRAGTSPLLTDVGPPGLLGTLSPSPLSAPGQQQPEPQLQPQLNEHSPAVNRLSRGCSLVAGLNPSTVQAASSGLLTAHGNAATAGAAVAADGRATDGVVGDEPAGVDAGRNGADGANGSGGSHVHNGRGKNYEEGRREAPPSADLVAENLENIDALALFEPGEDDEESDLEDESEPGPLYRRPAVLWFLGFVGSGLLLLLVGIILHINLESNLDAFRWFYFFSAMPLLYYTLLYILKHAFMLLEWWFFRESLLYLMSMQQKALWLLFFLALLPWFCTVFWWAWCSSTAKSPHRCRQPAYEQATRIMWNILLCFMLFSLANLLKAVLAKLLTTHFYRTAHFKKLKKALEKEYVLQILSRPRRLLVPARVPPHPPGEGARSVVNWLNLGSFFRPGGVTITRRNTGAPTSVAAAARSTPEGVGTANAVTGGWAVQGALEGGGVAGVAASKGGTPSLSTVMIATTAADTAKRESRNFERTAVLAAAPTPALPIPVPPLHQENVSGTTQKAVPAEPAPDTCVEAPSATARAAATAGIRDNSGIFHAARFPPPPLAPPDSNAASPAQLPSTSASLSSHSPSPPSAAPHRTAAATDQPRSQATAMHEGPTTLQPPPSAVSLPTVPDPPGIASRRTGTAPAAVPTALRTSSDAGKSIVGRHGLPLPPRAPRSQGAHGPVDGTPWHDAAASAPTGLSVASSYPLPAVQSHPHPQLLLSEPPLLQSSRAPQPLVALQAVSGTPASPVSGPGGVSLAAVSDGLPIRAQQPYGATTPVEPQSGSAFLGQAAVGDPGGRRESLGFLAQGLRRLLRRQASHGSCGSKGSARKAPFRAASGMAGSDLGTRVKRGEKETVSHAMVQVVTGGNALATQKGLRDLTDAELEKIRTAIVIKTQSALISKYTDKSDEEMAKEIGRVRRFAKALFFNVLPPDAGRNHLIQDDFLVFFLHGFDNGSGGGAERQPHGADTAALAAPLSGRPPERGLDEGNIAAAPLVAMSAPVHFGRQEAKGAVVGADKGSAIDRPIQASGRPSGRPAAAHAVKAARLRRARVLAAEEAAHKAFAVFDADGNGKVTRAEMREAVVNIYKERRNMARSLKDTETIVQSLEFGIGGVIHFVFAAVYLLIWGVDLLTGFSTFSATVLALTFVFGNSVKNMYESMLFLFVTHPYDVGDCILVGTEMYRVKKISLLYTDMIKSNGERMYMPNTALITQGIVNWTRSKTKSDSCRLVCDLGVAWEVREDIQAALRAYAKEHPGEFDGEPSCNFRELVDPLKVVLVCSWTYNFPPDESSRLSPARNGMLYIVQQKAREHRLQNTTFTETLAQG